jgi:hypothetical protein
MRDIKEEIEYNLSFQDAIEKCLNGEGFIRGKDYAPGFYIKNLNDVLVCVDGKKHHQFDFNMMITKGALREKYKLFTVANNKEIGLK